MAEETVPNINGDGGTDLSETPVAPQNGMAPAQPAYLGVATQDPTDNPHASPMSPLYDAYNELNEGYAHFLTSPAGKFMSGMKDYQFDPKAAALLAQGAKSDNPWGGIASGILDAWGNMVNPESAGGTVAGKGGSTGMGAGGGVETNYIKELQARREMQEFQIKKQKEVVDSALKDPTIVLSTNKLAQYNTFAGEMNDALKAGVTSADGKSKVFSPIQAKAMVTSMLQMVRPGARITADGTIDDDSLTAMAGMFGGKVQDAIKAFSSGTELTLSKDDVKGMANTAQSIRNSAIATINDRVDYLKKNASPTNQQYYDAMKIPTYLGANESGISTEQVNNVAASVPDSMQESANEHQEQKEVIGTSVVSKAKQDDLDKLAKSHPDGSPNKSGTAMWSQKERTYIANAAYASRYGGKK
jgi:hypothetical protein